MREKKTYRKTRTRLLIKLIVKLGRNFSSKRTEKLERDFSSKLVDRRNHGETTGMLALIPSLLLWSAFPLCSGGRYRRSAEWGTDLVPGPYCASRGHPQCCKGRDDKCSVEVLGSLCYCDSFCFRTAEDCCPDYDVTCLGIAPVTKGIFLMFYFVKKKIKTLELTWNILFLLIWFSILYKKQLKRSEFPVPCSVDKFGVKADFHFI